MKYRKKPVVIDAIQWNGENMMETNAFIAEKPTELQMEFTPKGRLLIHTMEGLMEASKDDFIIRGIKGELYPCKPDIFEKTYEKAYPNDGEIMKRPTYIEG